MRQMALQIASVLAAAATSHVPAADAACGPRQQACQQQQAGYPRVIGGYVAGPPYPGTGVYGADPSAPAAVVVPPGHPMHPASGQHAMLAHQHGGMIQVQPQHAPVIQSPPWRPMVAPGSPPVGEGHVPLPLNPETFGGAWGTGATPAGAPAGTTITFSARPQKPFKPARLVIRGTKVGTSAVGNLVGQIYVGTDLQQGEVGNIDLETIGAATAFDTWVSLKQAEPGVWIRVQATLTAFPAAGPTSTDFELYTVNALGHYLH